MADGGKLPALQFYPGDWRKDPGVQALDYEERGIWFELLMFMHESDERGKLAVNGLPVSDESIARMLGINPSKAKQTLANLVSKGVASRDSAGCLVNRRMLRDVALSESRAKAGRKGGLSKALAKSEAKARSSVSSSSSTAVSTAVLLTSPQRAGEEKTDQRKAVEVWLGGHAKVLDLIDSDLVASSIKGLYLPSGTDERVWGSTSNSERPQLLATAIQRWAAEGSDFTGNFFRAIILKVISEGNAPDPDGDHPGMSSAEERERESKRFERVKSRASTAVAADIDRLNAAGAEELEAAKTAKAWLEDQPEEVKSAVTLGMKSQLSRLGYHGRGKPPSWMLGPAMLAAVRSVQEGAA